MFDAAFFNTESRRLWQTEQWQPKRIMTLFWRFDPLTVRMMFDDLYNETREVEGRVSRFLFGCDSLLRDYKKAHPTSIENNHYHDGFQMIALYLAFRYPETYAPYSFATFQKAMIRFGAKDIPQANDLARYFKVLRTLMTFLEKDGAVAPARSRRSTAWRDRITRSRTAPRAARWCVPPGGGRAAGRRAGGSRVARRCDS